jgi:hypothetical protein
MTSRPVLVLPTHRVVSILTLLLFGERKIQTHTDYLIQILIFPYLINKCMQEEIINILKKEKRPMSRSEIALKINQNPLNVSRAIKKLIKFKEINYKEISKDEAYIKYRSKRKLRIFYV